MEIILGYYHDSDDRITKNKKTKEMSKNADVYQLIEEDLFGIDTLSNGYSSILDMYSHGYTSLKNQRIKLIEKKII